ncbi:hypothetical protein AAF712_009324 [Marasmius tenuissimus]|uniref:Uncharacterized protein n=1 Tax=Marasmius tenuissimus TaxID=585030 RepID=A0ABR2ZQ13_9AGAR
MSMNSAPEGSLADKLERWSSHPILVKLYSGDSVQEDAQHWLRHIDRQCDRFGIPSEQRIQAALHFMRENVHDIFSEAVPNTKAQLSGSQDPVQSESESESEGRNKLIARLASGGLIAGGSSVLLPTAGIATLNAVGFTTSGVAAGSLAAGIQSAVYGGATGGLFSICQSIGATAVIASPAGIVLGAGAVAAGAGYFAWNRWNGTGNNRST